MGFGGCGGLGIVPGKCAPLKTRANTHKTSTHPPRIPQIYPKTHKQEGEVEVERNQDEQGREGTSDPSKPNGCTTNHGAE